MSRKFALLILIGIACPALAFAQAPPVGPGHCVANCGGGGFGHSGGGGFGHSGGGGGGGGGPGGTATGAAIGMGVGLIMQGIQQAPQVSQSAVQSQIRTIRDQTQTRHHKPKRPLG
jgi:hypothetical protein